MTFFFNFVFLGFLSVSFAMYSCRDTSLFDSKTDEMSMSKIPINENLEKQIMEESITKLYQRKFPTEVTKFEATGDLKKDLEILEKAVEALALLSEAIAIADPELEPLAIAFEVFDAILSIFEKFIHGESPEMKYLRKQFKILNQKLDDLMHQLQRAEDKIIEVQYLMEYKTHAVDRLQVINTSIWVFNQNTNDDTRDRLKRTFENTDYDPIQILHYIWNQIIGSGVPGVDLVQQIKFATQFSQPELDQYIKMFKNNAIQALLYIQYRSAFSNLTKNEAAKDFENAKKLVVDLSRKLVEARYNISKEIWSDFGGTRKPQAIADIEQIIYHNSGHKQSALKIRDEFSKKYPFNLWATAAYNPISGWDKHGWAWQCAGENGYLFGGLTAFRVGYPVQNTVVFWHRLDSHLGVLEGNIKKQGDYILVYSEKLKRWFVSMYKDFKDGSKVKGAVESVVSYTKAHAFGMFSGTGHWAWMTVPEEWAYEYLGSYYLAMWFFDDKNRMIE